MSYLRCWYKLSDKGREGGREGGGGIGMDGRKEKRKIHPHRMKIDVRAAMQSDKRRE